MIASSSAWNHPLDRYFFPLAHWDALIIAALIAAEVADRYVDSLLSGGAVIALLFATLAAAWGVVRHERALCLACADDLPLDAAEQAVGKRRARLRAFHLVADRQGLLTVALVAASVGSFWAWWSFPLIWVAFLTMAWGGRWHRILEPWCPFCRKGGGRGPHERSPDPVPDPTVEATR